MEPDNYPVLGEYIPFINEWLEGEATAPRKQRHTAKRIYDRLRAEAGYKGGYSSVKRYVRKKRFVLRQGLAGCLPLAHPMAHAQVDFGEFLRCDAEGNEHKAYELVMSFPYSDKVYAQVFPSHNQECLLIGMRRIFEYIGGVPARIRFYHDHALVASYRRCYGKNEELMDWTQYVRTLCRKPGAAEHTRFFSAMPLPWQSYLSQTRGQERKSALQLLDDIVRDGNAEFCVDILTLAQQNGRSDVDSVKQCYYSLLKEGKTPEPLDLLSQVPTLNYNPDISVYDGLTGGEANG